MPGIGTLINVAAIVAGGLVGLIGKKLISERIQDTLMKAMGLCVVFIGIGGAMEKMLTIDGGTLGTQGTILLIVSFGLGALVGEACNIEGWIQRFGSWLKVKTGNAGDNSFVGAFVTASFTVCIGAMAVVGAIQEGMTGDYSTYVLKAMIDFLIILVMTASLGKGCIFSAIPVGIWQGGLTLVSAWLAPFMTDLALDYISFTGSMLIFCVGVNLIWPNTFKVANMLPVVLAAAALGALGIVI